MFWHQFEKENLALVSELEVKLDETHGVETRIDHILDQVDEACIVLFHSSSTSRIFVGSRGLVKSSNGGN